MSEEIKMPKLFMQIGKGLELIGEGVRKTSHGLSVGFGSAYSMLRLEFFDAKKILKEYYDVSMMIVFACLLLCIILSCKDLVDRFKKDGK